MAGFTCTVRQLWTRPVHCLVMLDKLGVTGSSPVPPIEKPCKLASCVACSGYVFASWQGLARMRQLSRSEAGLRVLCDLSGPATGSLQYRTSLGCHRTSP